jgi:hypothetical protein
MPVVGHDAGHTQLAVTPSCANSTASDSINPINPNFEAA